MPKLFIVVNEDRFFLSHRKAVAIAAQKAGFEIVIVTKDTGRRKDIEKLGFKMLDLPISPTGMNPFQELKTYRFLKRLYNKENPDIVHHVGLKTILWGGLAAKKENIKGVVNAVSGLGGLFNGKRLSLTAKIILWIIGYSNNRNNVKVIFQNNDDLKIFLSEFAVKHEQVEFTKGSGIDLEDYSYIEAPTNGKLTVIFTGRMVKEKGVCDLIDAAELLKSKYSDKIKFILCGRLTPNKSGVSNEYLKYHCDGEYICWLGERNDVKHLLEQSHIMAFPSYYREGVPKSLIEASAIGRPIITCNSTGCRDVVDDGINGFLVPPKNPIEIANALIKLFNDTDLRIKMGKAARDKAMKEFSINEVVAIHMNIYNNLLK